MRYSYIEWFVYHNTIGRVLIIDLNCSFTKWVAKKFHRKLLKALIDI